MYDVEFVNRRSAQPVRIGSVRDEARVRTIVDALLAAWGIPTPASVQDETAFIQRLTRTGRYLWGEGDAHVIVTTSVP